MKAKWLDRGLVIGPYLMLCTNEKDYICAAKRLNVHTPLGFLGPNAGASTHTFTKEGAGSMACIVTMPIVKGRKISLVASILAHEATHVKQEFFRFIQEDKPSSEFEAYVMENIVHRLLNEYERQVKLK